MLLGFPCNIKRGVAFEHEFHIEQYIWRKAANESHTDQYGYRKHRPHPRLRPHHLPPVHCCISATRFHFNQFFHCSTQQADDRTTTCKPPSSFLRVYRTFLLVFRQINCYTLQSTSVVTRSCTRTTQTVIC